MKEKEVIISVILIIGLVILFLYFSFPKEGDLIYPGYLKPPGVLIQTNKEGVDVRVMKLGGYKIIHSHPKGERCFLNPKERDLEVIMNTPCVKRVQWTELTQEGYIFKEYFWKDGKGWVGSE